MADDLKLHGEIEIDTKKANEAFSELEGKVKKTFEVAPLICVRILFRRRKR